MIPCLFSDLLYYVLGKFGDERLVLTSFFSSSLDFLRNDTMFIFRSVVLCVRKIRWTNRIMSQGVANPAYEPSAPAGEYPESGEAVNRNVSISYPSSSQYPTLAESSKQYPSAVDTNQNPNVVAPATPSSTRYGAKVHFCINCF